LTCPCSHACSSCRRNVWVSKSSMKNRWASLLSQSMKRPFWRRQTAVAQKAVRLFPSRKGQAQREAFHEASRLLNERIVVAGLRAHDGGQCVRGLLVPDHVLADRAYYNLQFVFGSHGGRMELHVPMGTRMTPPLTGAGSSLFRKPVTLVDTGCRHRTLSKRTRKSCALLSSW
jgi:hypothetical protein